MYGEELYDAASSGALGALQCLIALFVEQKNAEGSTPLIGACAAGHVAVVEFFVKTCHADVNQVWLIVTSFK